MLHCIYDDPDNPWVGGGGAHRVWELYRRLTDRLEVEVAAGAYPGAVEGEREGVAYRYLGAPRSYPLSRLSYGMAATRRLRQGDYDAAVFDFSVYTPIRVPGDPRVGHVVHMPIGATARDRWGRVVGSAVRWRERRMLARAEWIQTTSHWMEAQLRPVVPADAAIDVVRSGVDEAFFQVQAAPAEHLLCYGRLDFYQKGLDLVLEAYAALRAAVGAAELPGLVIAGRGDRARMEAAVAERGLERVRVEAPVDRDRVLELFAGAVALLMPSRFEGLPVVPMEAMAAGVPVVAAQVGGLAEIIRDGQDGVLIPPDDSGALARATRRLIEDPQLRQRLSASARDSARPFRWDAIAPRHGDWLEALAAR